MANKRRPVQEAHERFTVDLFLENFNRWHHSQFHVIAEPNPPEAIIQSNHTIRWVEVTTAFWSSEFAIDLYSAATEGEQHKPSPDGVFIEPDAQFAAQFASVVKKKLEKETYELSRDLYGPGYLVVSIQYPLFGRDTLRFMERALSEVTINNRGCFRSIYIAYREFDRYKMILWRLP